MCPDRITGEALVDHFMLSRQVFTWDDPKATSALNEPTIEHASIACVQDEINNLVRKGDIDMMYSLLKFYDCPKTYYYKTKHAGPRIEDGGEGGSNRRYARNVCLNILGGTTPVWLLGSKEMVAAGKAGLYRRFMVVYSGDSGKIIANPFKFKTDPTLKGKLVKDLQIIKNHIKGPMVMSSEAWDLYEDYYTKHRLMQKNGTHPLMKNPFLAEYCSSRCTQMFKIAMVFCVSRTTDRIIEQEDLERAITTLEAAEKNMGVAFEHPE